MSTFQPIEAWVQNQGVDLATAVVVCHVKAVWQNEKTTISNTLCDEYAPRLAKAELMKDGQVVGVLTDEAQGAEGELFALLDKSLQEARVRFVLGSALVEKGDEPPRFGDPQPVSVARLGKLVEAEEEFFEALITNDRDALDRSAFKRYQQGALYQEHPCDFETFCAFREEFVNGPYVGGLELSDYIRWFHRSASHLTPEGQINEETKESLSRTLTVWKDQSEEVQTHYLHRNFEVHPRHRDVFDAFFREFRDGLNSPPMTSNENTEISPEPEAAPAARRRTRRQP